MSRPIQATIHAAALRHNLALARAKAPHSRTLAVIKANGYGHGLLRAAQGLRDADGFAVLGVEDAVLLREAGYRQEILLLEGLFHSDELVIAEQHRLAVVVHCREQLEMLEYAVASSALSVFLKLNTGMNRLGFVEAEFGAALERLRHIAAVADITLMTHFASADGPQGVAEQMAVFERCTAGLGLPRSLANSAALLHYPETHADWVRPGIMLYGALPCPDLNVAGLSLQPAMTFSSAIIAVQMLSPGASVGYGGLFIADRPLRVGVVACGYADGYPRHAPTGTPVFVAGRMTHSLGRVSMDMLCVDLSAIPEAGIGAPVELWGTNVAVDDVATAAGTVGYELLCAVAPRVPVVES